MAFLVLARSQGIMYTFDVPQRMFLFDLFSTAFTADSSCSL